MEKKLTVVQITLVPNRAGIQLQEVDKDGKAIATVTIAVTDIKEAAGIEIGNVYTLSLVKSKAK